MAFTDQQKHDIIFYLGYPAKTIVANTTTYSKILSDRLDNNPTEVETRAIKLVNDIKRIDEKLEEAACRFSTKRVGNIETNPDERRMLRAERARYAKLLAQLLDMPIGPTYQMASCANVVV